MLFEQSVSVALPLLLLFLAILVLAILADQCFRSLESRCANPARHGVSEKSCSDKSESVRIGQRRAS